MQIVATARVIKKLSEQVYLIKATASDLRVFSENAPATEGSSVIKVSAVQDLHGELSFAPSDVTVLALGSSAECVALLPAEATQPRAEVPPAFAKTGDTAFLTACREEKLPEEILELATNFLERIREFSGDALTEGLHRKWVTAPKNFLAITIQNRNKQFCVHVKKTAALESLSPALDIRDDRPGYVRFWLQTADQLEHAVSAAKHSFYLK